VTRLPRLPRKRRVSRSSLFSVVPVMPGGLGALRRGCRGFLLPALIALFLSQIACETAPLADLAKAKSEADQTRRQGAAQYAPDELSQAMEALKSAQRSVTLQSARAGFRRDYREAISFLQRARFYTVQARRLTEIRREEAQHDAEVQIAQLRDSLSRSQEIKRFLTPRDPSVHRLLVAAGIDLEVAEKKMKEEDFPGALQVARTGTGRVHEVEELLLSSMVRFTSHPDIPSWSQWIDDALRQSRVRSEVAFVVDKLRRRMTVYRSGKVVKVYSVDLGLGGMERKMRSGDDATPEGLYRIQEIRGPGQTKYYRAFLLDYPNSQDRRRFEEARRKGIIPKGANPGSLIEIHGEGGRDKDWTKGCVALTNREMDDLVKLAKVGTPVAIVGYNPKDERVPW
jgi:L,D-transpeptidase-like protein